MSEHESNKATVRRALHEVFAGDNFEVVDEIFDPEFINHEAGPNTPPGPEGLKVTVGWIRRSFGDLHYEIEDEIAAVDKVVVRVTSSGRHVGEFMGFPPTGKTFHAKQIHIYRLRNGKIVEHWSCRDDLTQAMQLGFIPSGSRVEGPASERPTPAGQRYVALSELPVGGGKVFPDERLVITQPAAGVIKMFAATCTHMGCTVGAVADGVISCPCHGSRFSATDGSVVRGPAAQPLHEYAVVREGDQIAVALPQDARR